MEAADLLTPDPGLDQQLLARVWGRLTARPLITTALLAVVFGVVNLWWVARFRDLGAYNVDEAGYIATGLRFHRNLDPTRPWLFVHQVLSPSGTGPMVPLLSVPVLLLGPRTVTTAMATQGVVVGLAAVASAGVVNRIAGRSAALIAGVVMLALPAMILSARTFQYAAATGVCLLMALWALLASEEGHRRPAMVAFGAAVGALLLTRTMSVAFLPGLGLSAVLLLERDRRTARNLLLAGATTLVVAGPWWFRSKEMVVPYLFRYGYGDRAGDFGTATGGERFVDRLGVVLVDIRRPFLLLGAVAVAVVAAHLVTRLRGGDPPRWSRRSRELGALVSVVLGGFAALLTSSNQGVWFELPLEMVAVTTVIAAVGAVGGRPSRWLAASAVLVSMATLTVSLADRGGPFDSPAPRHRALDFLAGGLDEKERTLGDADLRLLSDDRGTRAGAAEQWWAVSEGLVEAIEEHRGDGEKLVVTVSGSADLVNSQTLLLAYELAGLEPPWLDVPDTARPAAELTTYTEPEWKGRKRLLLLLSPRSVPFAGDRDVAKLRGLAEREGWRIDRRLPMPDGGHGVLMVRQP